MNRINERDLQRMIRPGDALVLWAGKGDVQKRDGNLMAATYILAKNSAGLMRITAWPCASVFLAMDRPSSGTSTSHAVGSRTCGVSMMMLEVDPAFGAVGDAALLPGDIVRLFRYDDESMRVSDGAASHMLHSNGSDHVDLMTPTVMVISADRTNGRAWCKAFCIGTGLGGSPALGFIYLTKNWIKAVYRSTGVL